MADEQYQALAQRVATLEAQVGGKKVKRKKDPNAPKKAPTAYNVFMKERVAAMKEEQGADYVHKTAFGTIGPMWKKMTDEEKQVYADKAKAK